MATTFFRSAVLIFAVVESPGRRFPGGFVSVTTTLKSFASCVLVVVCVVVSPELRRTACEPISVTLPLKTFPGTVSTTVAPPGTARAPWLIPKKQPRSHTKSCADRNPALESNHLCRAPARDRNPAWPFPDWLAATTDPPAPPGSSRPRPPSQPPRT